MSQNPEQSPVGPNEGPGTDNRKYDLGNIDYTFLFEGIQKNFNRTGRPGELSFSGVDDVQRPVPEEVTWGTPQSEYPDGNV